MTYMKKSYDTRFFRVLRSLQEDLIEERISEKEFEILIGFLIEKEFDRSIKHELKHVLPQPKRTSRGLGFLNYEWRKHSHARQ